MKKVSEMEAFCYDEVMSESLELYKKTTILFPVHNDKVILGMKKLGFGVGWWNGFGGKLNQGETYEDAAIRETQEEAGIVIKSLLHVASLHFYFNNQLRVVSKAYISRDFEGNGVETDEMSPQTFDIDELPYDTMWPADKLWIPKSLINTNVPLGFIINFDDDKSFKSIEEVDAQKLEQKF